MYLLNKWINLFQKYIKNKFVRFIFVGGLNTVFGYSIYCLMIWIGLSYVLATIVQQVLGVLFNFITTGTLVFENSNKQLLFKFVMTYVLTYFVCIGVNKSFQICFDYNTYFSGMGGTIVAAMVSYFLLRYYVFNNDKSKKTKLDE